MKKLQPQPAKPGHLNQDGSKFGERLIDDVTLQTDQFRFMMRRGKPLKKRPVVQEAAPLNWTPAKKVKT